VSNEADGVKKMTEIVHVDSTVSDVKETVYRLYRYMVLQSLIARP
jgi:hypothetical protein